MRFDELTGRMLLTEAAASRAEYLRRQWPKLTDTQVDQVLAADPTDDKQYGVWIARQLVAGDIRLPEDSEKLKQTLGQLNWLKRTKRLTGPDADVMRYRQYGDLAEKLDSVAERHGQEDSPRVADDEQGMVTIYYQPPWQIVRAKTQDACVKLASGSKWCVTQPKFARRYLGEGPLFFIFKHGKKFALLHQKDLRDPMDRALKPEQQRELAPVLWDARLLGLHSATVSDDLIIWVQPRPKIVEHDPDLAFNYMRDVLGGKRFPEGERALASSPMYAATYAIATKQPFELGEPVIARDMRAATQYAMQVLHKPFPLGEPAIFDTAHADPYYFEQYLKLVAKTDGEAGFKRIEQLLAKKDRSRLSSSSLKNLKQIEKVIGELRGGKPPEADGEPAKPVAMRLREPSSPGSQSYEQNWDAPYPEGQVGDPLKHYHALPHGYWFVLADKRPYAYVPVSTGVPHDPQTGRPVDRAKAVGLWHFAMKRGGKAHTHDFDWRYWTKFARLLQDKLGMSPDEAFGGMTQEDAVASGSPMAFVAWAKHGEGTPTPGFYTALRKLGAEYEDEVIRELVLGGHAGRVPYWAAVYLLNDGELMKRYFELRGAKRLPEIEKYLSEWVHQKHEAYSSLLKPKDREAFLAKRSAE